MRRIACAGAALDLLREGFGVFAVGFEDERLLQVLFGGAAVVVVEVGAGEHEVGFGAGLQAERGSGLWRASENLFWSSRAWASPARASGFAGSWLSASRNWFSASLAAPLARNSRARSMWSAARSEGLALPMDASMAFCNSTASWR